MATAFANLKFSTAKKPAQIAPFQIRRNKLVAKLDEQIAMATAKQNGTVYVAHKLEKVTDAETGVVSTVETAKRTKQWFFTADNGKLALNVRYGAKLLALNAKGMTAIEVAGEKELVSVLETVKAAVANGELDAAIAAASDKLRKGFEK